MKQRIFDLYSQNSGLSITPEIKVYDSRSEGRVQVRFFALGAVAAEKGGKPTQIRFLLEPWEAHDMAEKMLSIHKSGGKEKITHKFTTPDGTDVSTTITIEKWERNGKSGLGIAVSRGNGFISVPVGKDSASRFVYAAEFLKFLANLQCWTDKEAA